MEINDLVFKELLKRKYKLEGKTRVWDMADSKLWYLTPNQAQGFLDITEMDDYKSSIVKKELGLIKENLKEIVDNLPQDSTNLIDLGCGDGKKASLFIKELEAKKQVRYCPIDISSYMVSKAAETIRKLNINGDVLEFKWNISDFENLNNITPLLRGFGGKFESHFMMLLGNTLGNFDREDILHGISNSMEKNDVLVIGNGLNTQDKGEILYPYKNKLIDDFTIKTIEQIGISSEDVTFGVRFKNSRVEIFHTLDRDVIVTHLGKKIIFEKGDIIVSTISYKYTKNEFNNVLSKFFSKVDIYSDDENSYALAVCYK